MTDHIFPNKRTSADAVPKTSVTTDAEEDDKIVLDDECDSHCLINVVEIPNYLSMTTNKTFERMAQQNIYHSTTTIHLDRLGDITILMYQLTMIDLEKSLWTIYSKSGTGKILKSNESNLKLWPTCVKSMIQLSKRITTISDINQIDVNDNICLTFVTEHLEELKEKEKQIQQKLSEKKRQFHGYTNTIEDILQTFIQQHIKSLRLQYEYKIQLVELNYRENVLERAFLQQKPTEQQKQLIKRFFDRKYDYEEAKQEVLLLKQEMAQNKLLKTLACVQMPLPSSIHSLIDKNQWKQLQDRHDQMMKKYQNEMMKIYTETLEIKLRESQKLFDDEMATIWQGQRLLPTYERFNKTILDLLDRHLTLISSKVECIYNYKKLQQLYIKVPPINQ